MLRSRRPRTDTNPDWQPTAPTNTTLPVITGNAAQGGTLFASTGTFGGSATSFAYQWLRCDTDGNAAATSPAPTASSYAVVAADVGNRLRVRVTASGTSGSSVRDVRRHDGHRWARPGEHRTAEGDHLRLHRRARRGRWQSRRRPEAGPGRASSPSAYQWKKCMPRLGPCYRILTPAASLCLRPDGRPDRLVVARRGHSHELVRLHDGPVRVDSGDHRQSAGQHRPPAHLGVCRLADGRAGAHRRRAEAGPVSSRFVVSLRMAALRRARDDRELSRRSPGRSRTAYTTTEADLGLTLRVWRHGQELGRCGDRDLGSHVPDDPGAPAGTDDVQSRRRSPARRSSVAR